MDNRGGVPLRVTHATTAVNRGSRCRSQQSLVPAAAVKRIRAAKAEIVEKPHLNPAANHREVWIRDPDGYIVVLASGEADGSQRTSSESTAALT